MGEYNLIHKFKGYRAREDQTIVGADVLVSPSQNVVINTAGRIASVNGYVLDGSGSTVIDSGIISWYDLETVNGTVRNMRAGFLTSAANDGKLQYRYQSGTTVTWIDLATGLTSVDLSFANFLDTTEKLRLALWVNGTNNMYEWNGAVTTFASCTSNTITK